MAQTRNFADVIRRKLASNPELQVGVEKALLAAHVATLICQTRKEAHLTQAEMAKKVGTHQSVIARLEDADYDGHSLSMLLKIAAALDCRLKLEFEPLAAGSSETESDVLRIAQKPMIKKPAVKTKAAKAKR